MAAVLGPEAGKLIKDNGAADLQDVTISPSKGDGKHKDSEKETFYSISNAKKRIDLVLKKNNGNWQLASYSINNLAPSAGISEKSNTTGGGSNNATVKNETSQPSDTAAKGGEAKSAKGESEHKIAEQKGSAEQANKGSAEQSNKGGLAEKGSTSTSATKGQISGTGVEATQGNAGSAKIATNANGKNAQSSDNGKTSTQPEKNGSAVSDSSISTQKKQSNSNDILGGLTPEVAGAHPKPVITKQTKSSWLDDDKQNEVAMVPTAQKGNSSGKSKTDAAGDIKEQKDKKDKKDKQRADEEKSNKDKAAKEQANKSDSEDSAARSSAKISETLGTSTVRLRSGPGLNSHTLDEIPKGAKVQIIGKKNGWYKVAYSGKTGYVFSPLVDTKSNGSDSSKSNTKSAKNKENSAKAESAKSETAHENKTKDDNESKVEASAASGYSSGVVVHFMTVRDEHKKAISSVKVGERVVVLSGLKNNRYKIRKPDGTVGYVAKEALDVKVETPPEFVP